MALNKKNRVKNKKDFDRVFEEGKAVRSSFLFIKFVPNSLGFNRFGFVVSSKVAKKAVDRNRVRRIISEVIRKNEAVITTAYDIVIITTPGAAKVSKQDLSDITLGVLRKANLTK